MLFHFPSSPPKTVILQRPDNLKLLRGYGGIDLVSFMKTLFLLTRHSFQLYGHSISLIRPSRSKINPFMGIFIPNPSIVVSREISPEFFKQGIVDSYAWFTASLSMYVTEVVIRNVVNKQSTSLRGAMANESKRSVISKMPTPRHPAMRYKIVDPDDGPSVRGTRYKVTGHHNLLRNICSWHFLLERVKRSGTTMSNALSTKPSLVLHRYVSNLTPFHKLLPSPGSFLIRMSRPNIRVCYDFAISEHTNNTMCNN
ncbi:12810_t:CDS:2 [Acaulospora morrowiae]|uniref:12810_t:CDS:1 n=1 Tax=Acaulospora morrowiae TaxID=94023 RepID=A0A9N8VNB8_9GLOM|nr:12810_t:CDS:2 [Acaulospora morrowiae]